MNPSNYPVVNSDENQVNYDSDTGFVPDGTESLLADPNQHQNLEEPAPLYDDTGFPYQEFPYEAEDPDENEETAIITTEPAFSFDGAPMVPLPTDLDTVGGILECMEQAISEFVYAETQKNPSRGIWAEFCLRCMPSLTLQKRDPAQVKKASIDTLRKFDVAIWTQFYAAYPFIAGLADAGMFLNAGNTRERGKLTRMFAQDVRKQFQHVCNQHDLLQTLESVKLPDENVFQGTILLPIVDPRKGFPMDWDGLKYMRKYSDFVTSPKGVADFESLLASIHRTITTFSTYGRYPEVRREPEEVKQWYRLSALDLPSLHRDDFYAPSLVATDPDVQERFKNQRRNDISIWVQIMLHGSSELQELASKKQIFQKDENSKRFLEEVMMRVQAFRQRYGLKDNDYIPKEGSLLPVPTNHMLDDKMATTVSNYQDWKKKQRIGVGKTRRFYVDQMLEPPLISEKTWEQVETPLEAPIPQRMPRAIKYFNIEGPLTTDIMREASHLDIQDILEQELEILVQLLDTMNPNGGPDFIFYTAPHLNLKAPLSAKEVKEQNRLQDCAVDLWACAAMSRPILAQLLYFGHLFPRNQQFVNRVWEKFVAFKRNPDVFHQFKPEAPMDPLRIYNLNFTDAFKRNVFKNTSGDLPLTRDQMKESRFWTNYLHWKSTGTIRREMQEAIDDFALWFPQYEVSVKYLPSLYPTPFRFPQFTEKNASIVSAEHFQRMHRQEENDVTAWALLCVFYGFRWYLERHILFAQHPHFRERVLVRARYFEENFDELRRAVSRVPYPLTHVVDFSTVPLDELVASAPVAWVRETSFVTFPNLDSTNEQQQLDLFAASESFVLPHHRHDYQRLLRSLNLDKTPNCGLLPPSPTSRKFSDAFDQRVNDAAVHNLDSVFQDLSFFEEVPSIGMDEPREAMLARVMRTKNLPPAFPTSVTTTVEAVEIPSAVESREKPPTEAVDKEYLICMIDAEIEKFILSLNPDLQEEAELYLRLMPFLHFGSLCTPEDVVKAQALKRKLHDLRLNESKVWASFLLYRKKVLQAVLEEQFLVPSEDSGIKDDVDEFRLHVLKQCERFRDNPVELQKMMRNRPALNFKLAMRGGMPDVLNEEGDMVDEAKLKQTNRWIDYIPEVITPLTDQIEELCQQLKSFTERFPQFNDGIQNIPSLHNHDYNLARERRAELVSNQRENDITAWAYFMCEYPFPIECLANHGHIFNTGSVSRNFYLECQLRKRKIKEQEEYQIPQRLLYSDAVTMVAYNQGVPMGARRNPLFRQLPFWKTQITLNLPLQDLAEATLHVIKELPASNSDKNGNQAQEFRNKETNTAEKEDEINAKTLTNYRKRRLFNSAINEDRTC